MLQPGHRYRSALDAMLHSAYGSGLCNHVLLEMRYISKNYDGTLHIFQINFKSFPNTRSDHCNSPSAAPGSSSQTETGIGMEVFPGGSRTIFLIQACTGCT
jgi:hypothetical protein